MSVPVRWIRLSGDSHDDSVPGIYANIPDLLALLETNDIEYVRYGLQETLDQAIAWPSDVGGAS